MAEQQPAGEPHAAELETRTAASEPGAATLDARRTVFAAASRLLAYPDPALWALLSEIAASLRQPPTSEPVSKLARVAEWLHKTDVFEQAARYVATFDFDDAAALYLTAHELGDSRRRGQALVELRALLRAAGFEETTEELPDYLPLLLEFLAHAPASVPLEALEQRLSVVCERISTRLDTKSPYREVLDALRAVLPAPATTDPEQRFTQREQADTGEMPYPLRYD
jgi:nitrate reductase molybdenum cofactor assembly chaperone NarJ/NarW